MSFEHLSPPIGWTFLIIVVALALASVVVAQLTRRRTGQDYRELVLRVRTWWIIVVLFAVAVLLNRVGVLIFFGCVSGLALREYFTLVPPRAGNWRILLWAYL